MHADDVNVCLAEETVVTGIAGGSAKCAVLGYGIGSGGGAGGVGQRPPSSGTLNAAFVMPCGNAMYPSISIGGQRNDM